MNSDQQILHSCWFKNSNPNSLQDGLLIAEPLMIIYLQFRKYAVFPRKNTAEIWFGLHSLVQGQRRGRDQPLTKGTSQGLNMFWRLLNMSPALSKTVWAGSSSACLSVMVTFRVLQNSSISRNAPTWARPKTSAPTKYRGRKAALSSKGQTCGLAKKQKSVREENTGTSCWGRTENFCSWWHRFFICFFRTKTNSAFILLSKRSCMCVMELAKQKATIM